MSLLESSTREPSTVELPERRPAQRVSEGYPTRPVAPPERPPVERVEAWTGAQASASWPRRAAPKDCPL